MPLEFPTLVVPLAEGFSDLLVELRSKTIDTYRGLPLAEATEEERELVVKHVARQVDKSVHKDSIISDAQPGTAKCPVDYDWLHDDGLNAPWRIKAVAAQLTWGEKLGGWRMSVCNLRMPVKDKKDVVALHVHKDDVSRNKSTKKGPFDELYLGLYTPDGIYIYKHDQVTGVSYKRDPNAKRNRGSSRKREAQGSYTLSLIANTAEQDYQKALDKYILKKLDATKEKKGGCRPLAFVAWDDYRLKAALEAHPISVKSEAYTGVPLALMSAEKLEEALRAMALLMDARLFRDATVERERSEPGPAGIAFRPGLYDWKRIFDRSGSAETFVICRTATLSWEGIEDHRGRVVAHRWQLEFENVPTTPQSEGLHPEEEPRTDELQLAMFTPRGVYIFRHDGVFGVWNYKKTRHITIAAEANEANWQVALDAFILPQLRGQMADMTKPEEEQKLAPRSSCELVSFIDFEGDNPDPILLEAGLVKVRDEEDEWVPENFDPEPVGGMDDDGLGAVRPRGGDDDGADDMVVYGDDGAILGYMYEDEDEEVEGGGEQPRRQQPATDAGDDGETLVYDGRGDGTERILVDDDDEDLLEELRLDDGADAEGRRLQAGSAPPRELQRDAPHRASRRLAASAALPFVQYRGQEGPLSQLLAISWPSSQGEAESCPLASGEADEAAEVCGLEEDWFSQWEADVDQWWAATPYREGLQACLGALGLHLASRFEAAQRAWLALRGQQPPPPRTPAAAAEPGCSWVGQSASQLQIPAFPEWPAGPDAFDVPFLPPLPRLLPNVLQPGWVQSQVPASLSSSSLGGAQQPGSVQSTVPVSVSSLSASVSSASLGVSRLEPRLGAHLEPEIAAGGSVGGYSGSSAASSAGATASSPTVAALAAGAGAGAASALVFGLAALAFGQRRRGGGGRVAIKSTT